MKKTIFGILAALSLSIVSVQASTEWVVLGEGQYYIIPQKNQIPPFKEIRGTSREDVCLKIKDPYNEALAKAGVKESIYFLALEDNQCWYGFEGEKQPTTGHIGVMWRILFKPQ